ncbi:scarecrow-like protein 32 [Dioscorea cayenensis subsp. rotundata]|uniref:Scarecrow-like protein 32 n=1 Tax=Dioscorea cayennensis subsp. rotundata TaxID=55577 RepID=A0AB40CI60_DIOCR|nr:scarecrow-like protein 32 [Dioscorea cayenensis subsp. rotundata]
MKAELRSNSTKISLPNPNLFQNQRGSSSLSGTLRGTLGSLDGACIEKLLLHCACALESSDVTLAQQVMWVLNNIASSNGDPNQRLTSWFLRAFIFRASRLCPTAMSFQSNTTSLTSSRPMSVTEFAGYVDLTPWHRFGFCASNGAIYKAIEGHSKVHILDLSITHCMQWPTLIDALAKRPEGAPFLRITVPSTRPPVPPLLNVSIEEVGLRLANFARSRDVPFEFNALKCSDSNAPNAFENLISSFYQELTVLNQLSPSSIVLREDETLIVNCQSWLRYLPEESQEANSCKPSTKDGFLQLIRGLNPHIITVTDEYCDLDSPSLAARTMACFNYLWIPFDTLETFLPKDSPQRMDYEADIGQKIENIIGFEGAQRIERPESGARLARRMKKANFSSVSFSEKTVKEVKFILDEHASGWGMKKEEDMLVLTWKGHSSVFTTAWVPNGCNE